MFKKILIVLASLLAVACSKNNDVATETKSDISDPSFDPSEINIYGRKVYSQDEFCDFVGASFDDYLASFSVKKLNFVPKNIVSEIFGKNSAAVDSLVAEELGCSVRSAGKKWGVKVYNYTYGTVSYTQEPIILSAALCVPVLIDVEGSHAISAMSLCPPHMPMDKEACPTANGTILMARAAFNHAVVVPDYQGRGITSSTPYSSLHTHDHALQAIHAAMAARTILREEGFMLKDDFPLYNVGVSEGGETSYEAHKMIENDISEGMRDTLNLKLTFSANGIAQHSLYVESQMSIYEYTDPEMHKVEMDFYKDAFDCFTQSEKQGHDGIELYSPELLDSTGKIILDSPIIKVLQEGVLRNDITYNWNPQHKLTLAASKDDNDVLFEEHAMYMYKLVKDTPEGETNENVSLMEFETPISSVISEIVGPDYMFAHIAADICCFVHAIRYEDPGSAPIYSIK